MLKAADMTEAPQPIPISVEDLQKSVTNVPQRQQPSQPQSQAQQSLPSKSVTSSQPDIAGLTIDDKATKPKPKPKSKPAIVLTQDELYQYSDEEIKCLYKTHEVIVQSDSGSEAEVVLTSRKAKPKPQKPQKENQVKVQSSGTKSRHQSPGTTTPTTKKTQSDPDRGLTIGQSRTKADAMSAKAQSRRPFPASKHRFVANTQAHQDFAQSLLRNLSTTTSVSPARFRIAPTKPQRKKSQQSSKHTVEAAHMMSFRTCATKSA
jgi:hypothetical protein